jgi:hypothetical protein
MALKRLNTHHRVLRVLLQRLVDHPERHKDISDDLVKTWAAHSHALEKVVFPKLRELHLSNVADVVQHCARFVGPALADVLVMRMDDHPAIENLTTCLERLVDVEQELLWPYLLKRMSESDVDMLGSEIELAAEVYLSQEFLERIELPDVPGAALRVAK